MRDPDLTGRAQRAALELERAWDRWRTMHGYSREPMPAVSSYVGYSLEEPWGQPRVVFGIEAREAEQLAALLQTHECSGPVYAGLGAAAGSRAEESAEFLTAGSTDRRRALVPSQSPGGVADREAAWREATWRDPVAAEQAQQLAPQPRYPGDAQPEEFGGADSRAGHGAGPDEDEDLDLADDEDERDLDDTPVHAHAGLVPSARDGDDDRADDDEREVPPERAGHVQPVPPADTDQTSALWRKPSRSSRNRSNFRQKRSGNPQANGSGR